MLFKKITSKIARESMNDFLVNHYSWKYKDLKNFIKFEIDKPLFKKISKRSLSKKEMIKLSSSISQKDVEKSIESIKRQWNLNSKKILKVAYDITGIKINEKTITCFIDPYTNLGFYSKKDISISSRLSGEGVNFVLFHELFHIYYWKFAKKLKLKLNKDIAWKLSEAVIYLLQKDSRMRKFWKKEKIYVYPNVKSVYSKVHNLWGKRDFTKFLVDSYKILK